MLPFFGFCNIYHFPATGVFGFCIFVPLFAGVIFCLPLRGIFWDFSGIFLEEFTARWCPPFFWGDIYFFFLPEIWYDFARRVFPFALMTRYFCLVPFLGQLIFFLPGVCYCIFVSFCGRFSPRHIFLWVIFTSYTLMFSPLWPFILQSSAGSLLFGTFSLPSDRPLGENDLNICRNSALSRGVSSLVNSV